MKRMAEVIVAAAIFLILSPVLAGSRDSTDSADHNLRCDALAKAVCTAVFSELITTESLTNHPKPPGVTVDGSYYTFAIPISEEANAEFLKAYLGAGCQALPRYEGNGEARYWGCRYLIPRR